MGFLQKQAELTGIYLDKDIGESGRITVKVPYPSKEEVTQSVY
jgi:hypothetical protein